MRHNGELRGATFGATPPVTTRQKIHVNYRVYKTLFGLIGGCRIMVSVLATLVAVLFLVCTDLWLAIWTKQVRAYLQPHSLILCGGFSLK